MILESLKQLGQLNNSESSSDVFIEPLNTNDKFKVFILFLNLKEENNSLLLEKLDYEEYSPANYKKWLYRKDKSNGKPFSPTIKLNHKKLLSKKISDKEGEIKQIRKRYSFLKDYESLSPIISNIDYDEIVKLVEKINEKNNVYFFSIKINDKYPYEYPLFEQYFKSRTRSENTGNEIFERGICFLCNQEKSVVGDYSPFGFYNKDKRGFFSNLDKENKIYAFPICNDCKIIAESGKRKILSSENHFNHPFYTKKNSAVKYFILPVSVTGSLSGLMLKINDYSKKLGLFSLLSGSKKREENEKDLLEFLSEMENDLSFSIFFYEEPQGRSFRVRRTIEQRLPSDFNKINAAKRSVENSGYFRNLREMNPDLFIDLDFFLEILNDSESNFDLNVCLDLFTSIFYLKEPKSLSTLIEHKIKNSYIQLIKNGTSSEKKMKEISLYLLSFKQFFKNLNNGVTQMVNINDLNQFVNEQFINDTQRASFVLGMMAQLLLKTQRNIRGSEPFLNKLSEFRITTKKIKELAPEIISKLKWYSIEDSTNGLLINNKMNNLNSEFSKYAMSLDKENYKDSIELSFAFILGMGQLDKMGGN